MAPHGHHSCVLGGHLDAVGAGALLVIIGAMPIHECHWKESIKKTYNALFIVKKDLQKDDDSDAAA